MSELRDCLFAFALLALAFAPLERAFPARRQDLLRTQWWLDLAFFAGQYVLWGAPVVALLMFASRGLDQLPLAGLRSSFASLPFAAQFLIAIALSDCAIYWAHRLQHTNAFLWRFHRVHHTSPALDWLAAHREHPLDNLYTRAVENLPLLVLGFPLHTIAGFAVFRGVWALYIHSNVALTPGPLRYLLGAPRLHHWHHEAELGGRVNFANLSPLMDLAFGTYHDPRCFPQRYGLLDNPPRNYLQHMLEPLLPARREPDVSGVDVRPTR